jgi:hypothetical protein
MEQGQLDSLVLRQVMRRIQDILEAARERARRGQTLTLDVSAQFRLYEARAVHFQLASAILEESQNMSQEEVVCELLSLGLARVLSEIAGTIYGDENSLSPDTLSHLASDHCKN